jgi:putative acetyltransferase
MQTDLTIRAARAADADMLLGVWERSVRATHHFLTEADVLSLRPFVIEWLATNPADLWVLEIGDGTVVGFMGLAEDKIDALFIGPEARRRGGGKLFVAHAQALRGGSLAVDVNEQNEAGRAFYERAGFRVVGRSPVDDAGRPFPLLHMRRPAPVAA